MARVVGGAQTISKMRNRFPGNYPRSLSRGDGARVWGDGQGPFVDWACSLGAVSLGYHHEAVDHAVYKQVRERGPIFSLPDVELEEAVAEQLCALVPCAEAVRFLKTGSEACEAAVRVARAHTGREIILFPDSSYHSWHSWYAASREHAPGVPLAMKGLVRTFKYNAAMNDPRGYGNVLEEVGADRVAAIMLEPTLYEAPRPGFLESLRDTATAIGALLIFDEMVTGFRWHAGGYQALCGVVPDLATFGKGMGNGYPIAALVGRAEPMRWARLASGTFGGDCVGLAAARATMKVYASPASPQYPKLTTDAGVHRDVVTSHMYVVGDRLMLVYNEIARQHGAPTRAEGQPPHPRFVWDEVSEPIHGVAEPPSFAPPSRKNRWRASLFFQECARRGVLFHPDGTNISLAHGEEELSLTREVIDTAMTKTVRAIESGTVREQIEGDPISSEPAWRVTG